MINDRLGALKAVLNDNYEDNSDITINMENSEDFMSEFFNEVEELSQNLDKISSTVEEVRKKHSDILSAPSTNQKVKEDLEDLMVEIKRLSNKVRNKLKAMGVDIENLQATNHISANLRIKQTQHSALSRRFVDIMTYYNNTQTEYRQKCKDRIKRQLEITGKMVTDGEIEEMLESGNPAIFTQGIVTDTQKVKQSLAEIEDRHADIMKLEKSIRELHDMFLDMAVLVESQGELIDRIEYNVHNTVDFVDKAKTELASATIYQSKARKKVICLVIVAIIILTILGLIIGFNV